MLCSLLNSNATCLSHFSLAELASLNVSYKATLALTTFVCLSYVVYGCQCEGYVKRRYN